MANPIDNKRAKIIGGAGVGLVAVVLLLKVFTGGGGGSDVPAPTNDFGSIQSTTTTTVPAPDIPGGSFDVFATKDPFAPVISIDNGTPSTPGVTGVTGSTGGGGSTTPTVGTAVAVVDVYDQAGTLVAAIRVGSTVYTVSAGDTFATSYMVVSLEGACAQLLYGDAPFQLCKGEEVIK
ncbi:hypothetical protein IMCC26256_111015 [Actinobacteria bacterium IMCC26256]|jgi:hypothetical protein|nr:hypothetical protein IMCC26256_111015 [Actinobacteria bacterium IMCC26256]